MEPGERGAGAGRDAIRALFLGADTPVSTRLAALLAQAPELEAQIHWEETLDAALERLIEESFDVLLLGSELALSAPDLVERVSLAGTRTAVLVCTAAAEREHGRAALLAGAADHLVVDGIDEEVLVRAVRLAALRVGAAELRARHEALLDGARDALWEWDVRSDRVRFTPRWGEMLGLAPGAEGERAADWFARVHPNDLSGLRQALDQHLDGRNAACEVEYRIQHADGSYRWVACRGVARRDASGAALVAGSHTDVHERKTHGAAIPSELLRDPLTGLPSRALFLERLGRSVARIKLDPRELFAVLVLDLDRFQKVNAGLGHAAGDRLLTEVTGRLSAVLREGDTLTRLGSDKFAVLVETLRRPAEALRQAEKIQAALGPRIVLDGEEIFPSASVGVALGGPGYKTPEDVMSDAYSAMHRAKEMGGARFELFDPEEQARSVARLRLESDLRRAIERQELCLHYQPIVEMATGRIAGFEALVRWIHPERGLVSPGKFVPVAEEIGLISQIGGWVLDEACRTSRRWNQRYANGRAIAVSVNLSGRQFGDPDLAGRVEATIKSHGLDPRGLKLEITESVLMEHTARNAGQLQRLRDLGLELMIDDFGTGYSSLSSLHRFPIATLKIDRTFVNRMEFEEENSEIVRTIMTLGRNLDMTVVAEGVETQAQLELLRELGCDMGQGFLFSNAVDAESAEAWLQSLPHA
jgi:diguanylate cyclase (GGDEF)-like protein/PAS domain S-box-containing protein